MTVTPFKLAQRFVGHIRELPGETHHPLIQFGFMLCGWDENTPDEVPWCSAIQQIPSWLLDLPRSKSARARSWLLVGRPLSFAELEVGYDVLILSRGPNAPGPNVIDAPGHVGFYAGREDGGIWVMAGNQGNRYGLALFPEDRVIGCRRLI